MQIELFGITKYVFILCVGGTSLLILIIGTYVLWHKFLWDFLVKRLMMSFKIYNHFVSYIFQRKQFKKYLQKPEHNPLKLREEFIVCAAVKFLDLIITGYNHTDCYVIIELISNEYATFCMQKEAEGFLTSEKRFVDRKEAWKIAVANNQINFKKFPDNGENSELISENLY